MRLRAPTLDAAWDENRYWAHPRPMQVTRDVQSKGAGCGRAAQKTRQPVNDNLAVPPASKR